MRGDEKMENADEESIDGIEDAIISRIVDTRRGRPRKDAGEKYDIISTFSALKKYGINAVTSKYVQKILSDRYGLHEEYARYRYRMEKLILHLNSVLPVEYAGDGVISLSFCEDGRILARQSSSSTLMILP